MCASRNARAFMRICFFRVRNFCGDRKMRCSQAACGSFILEPFPVFTSLIL
ncbi:hypothetical protein LguiA_026998 [Lonicera macranthoides]